MFCGIYRDYVYECKDDPPNDILALGYGSIYNHADGKNYTTKKSYFDALKQTGHHIKDYK